MMLLYVFVIYRVNILLGGFFTIMAFLFSRFIYELLLSKGRPIFLMKFIRGVYGGVKRGAEIMVPIGAMLAALGIVVRVLTATGLAEKISYQLVSSFGSSLWILLFFTMILCIVFGMAVTTVAAYILVVTLAAPALLKVGIQPLVAHFVVFYWAMLSNLTPPVAGVCVVTARLAKAKFLSTCWESMKLGAPKFILPFFFISYPEILSFTFEGFVAFLIATVGFITLSAGIQSEWGFFPQMAMIVLSCIVLFVPAGFYLWVSMVVTIVLFPIFWKRYAKKTKFEPSP
jgi:TRAP-type uncharacterized transport system fused permease subunit